jgi:hypothetical protein
MSVEELLNGPRPGVGCHDSEGAEEEEEDSEETEAQKR